MVSVARLLCLLGRHRRSRGRARRIAGGWQSHCRGCGAHMEKGEEGHWRLTAPVPVAPKL